MIGLCGLSVFIGSLMKMGWDGPQSFQYAMTQCCAVAVSLFGGYFLAAYLINGLRVRMFMLDSDIPLAQQFAGYALVVVFMLRIVIAYCLILVLWLCCSNSISCMLCGKEAKR